jgi:hypothetical protein
MLCIAFLEINHSVYVPEAIMEELTNIISALAAVAVVLIAYKGLSTWKEQLKGNVEFEIGRKLLRSLYRVRDAVGYVRNPFASASEIGAALKEAGFEVSFRDEDYHWKSQQALYMMRWKMALDAFTELDLASFEAEVLWGKDITEKLERLRRLLHKLNITIVTYIRDLQTPRRHDPSEEEIMESDDILYAKGGATEEGYSRSKYTAEFSDAINQIEDFIRPRLNLNLN